MKKKIEKEAMNQIAKGITGLVILLIVSIPVFAQNVGISPAGASAPNPVAGLDVKFGDKGFLISRVELQTTADPAPVTAHIAGMLVYNTATAGDVTPGFYYNDGTKWISGFPKANAAGDIQYWNGTAWVIIPIGQQGQLLQLSPTTGLPVWANNTLQAIVVTKAATSILSTSAASGGTVLNDGGSPVSAYGVCWSTSANPTIAGNKTTDGSGIGNYTSTITGLTAATMYYFRAYATTGNGTVYGTEYNFITP
ncbi:MAG: hypothetical protein QM800_02015 [Paludibacter sp.]